MSDLTEAEIDVIVEAAHPSRPDRAALVRAAVERVLTDRLRAVEAERDRVGERGDHWRAIAQQAEADLAAERAAHEALRAGVRVLAEPQWRTNRGHEYDTTAEAWAAGRNEVIDSLRDLLDRHRAAPADAATEPAPDLAEGPDAATADTADGGREALALALFQSEHLRAALAFGVPQEAWEDCRQGIAEAVENSDWLAARDAQVRREAAVEAWGEGYAWCFDAGPDDAPRSLRDNPYRADALDADA